jgi:hypothetical protein
MELIATHVCDLFISGRVYSALRVVGLAKRRSAWVTLNSPPTPQPSPAAVLSMHRMDRTNRGLGLSFGNHRVALLLAS